MGLKLIIPPASEPVTLDEAKLHLRIDGSDEDTLINGLIRAAREHVEAFTRRAIMPQTWELTLDWFPGDQLRIPLPPLQTVESITYRALDGTTGIVDPSIYVADPDSLLGRIVLAPGKAWPSLLLHPASPVRIRFTAGYSEAPESVRQAMLLIIGHWYNNREAVHIGSAASPLPLAVDALLWPLRVW